MSRDETTPGLMTRAPTQDGDNVIPMVALAPDHCLPNAV